MKIRLQGALPEGWRDHGVFAEVSEKAKPLIDELIAKKAELDRRLGVILDKAKAGDRGEIAALPNLAEESALLANEIEASQREAEQAEAQQKAQTTTARRRRFEEVIARAKDERAEFERLFRETCLALGALCASVDEAAALANSLSTELGMWPEHRNAVREISEPLNPLPALRDSGLRPTLNFGWNLSIAVVPLHEIGKEKP